MKQVFFIAFIIALQFVSVAQMPMNMQMPKKEAAKPQQKTYYTCTMHPEVKMDKPGKCPKCGMTLVKKTIKASTPEKKKPMNMHMKDTSGNGMNMQTDSSMHNHGMHDMSMNDSSMQQMNMQKDSTMQMGNMQDMQGMDMNGIADYKKAKEDLGIIKYKENSLPPRTVHYDLYVTDTTVTFGKKTKHAIAVNGQIPMPTLTFTEGDTAEIVVHNEMNEPTSLHWHGLFLPNKEDGVAYLTQMPIPPHSVHTYRFPIVQHGTHWYHSHFELQEQIGMYGMFIMNKRKEWDIPTVPVVISEWTDMKPEEVNRRLHNASDWFAIQKGSTQSYSEAIKSGNLKTKLANEWKRMNAMDLTDIFYDNFLLNGKNQTELTQFKAGDKVRLRIANGGASDYFWLSYAGGKMTVVATDGNDVEPVEVDRLIIAVSETYDVIVTIPENKSYEFLVTPEDRTSHASLWLGSGEKVAATKMSRPKYFAGMKMMNDMMDMKGNMIEMQGMNMQNQVMDMNTVMYPEITGEEETKKKKDNNNMQEHDMHGMQMPNNNSMQGMNMASESSDIVTLNYGMLRSPEKTTLPAAPIRELKFDLTGNMNRYVWSMDNKTVSESDKILIKKGENLRIILFNNSMMRHPMHLHGHDFRLLNGQGDYSPMKNIIDIMPMERDTIEFAASEPGGDWFFHCHILYHMMSGMGRVFSYDTSMSNPYLPDPKLAQRKLNADDRMFHFMAKVGAETNGSDGEAMFANTRWKASTLWHLGYHSEHGFESETMVGRYIGRMQWLYPYVGFDYHYKTDGVAAKGIFDWMHSPQNIFGSNADAKNLFGQVSNKNNRHTVVAGVAYTLPTLTVADFRVDGDGKFRFQLSREDISLTPRFRFNWMINTDKEYTLGLRYIATKYISISSHYDSDMGLGAGITFTY